MIKVSKMFYNLAFLKDLGASCKAIITDKNSYTIVVRY